MSHCHCHACHGHSHTHEHEHEHSSAIPVRLSVSAILFALAALLPCAPWIKTALYLLAYATIGYDILWAALKNILHGALFDEAFLMSLATVGALVIGELPEAVAVMFFYQLGEWLQSLAVGKSRRSIAALMDIRPEAATVLRMGREVHVAPEEVHCGEIILVRPGERIALDGVVVRGEGSINNAALTGESLPVSCSVGQRVLSGGICLDSVLEIRCESTYRESTVARILELVEHAAEKKTRTERFITRFSRIYTPVVVLFALGLALLPPFLLSQSFAMWLQRALTFLVISCPCALVVSVPLSFMGGIGAASRHGILVKGAADLEQLAKVKIFAFDKTGTLTEGRFTLTELHPQFCTEAELLRLAATAEQHSKHPIAQSIVEAYGKPTPAPQSLTELAGRGVCAVIDGDEYHFGNARLMRELGVALPDRKASGTLVYGAKKGRCIGCLVIADEVKPDASSALAALRAKTVMLTGDSREVAQGLAARVGVDEVHAQLLPQEKVEQLERLQQNGVTAFVGDGINDAPVLARADVGIAMGGIGSDAAIESADIVLMHDSLTALPLAQSIARKTLRIVRQNIVLALGTKAFILLLGAMGLAPLWLAVFGDVGVMLLATCNALRCLRVKQLTNPA